MKEVAKEYRKQAGKKMPAVSGEKEVGALLVQFEQNYPNVVTGKNVNEIAGNPQKITDRASILAKLRERKTEIEQRTPAQKRDNHEK